MLFSLSDVADPIQPATGEVKQADAVSIETPTAGTICPPNSDLSAVLPRIEKGKHYHIVSAGLWAAHELLFHLLAITGPARVMLATYSMSESAVRMLVNGLEAGLITELHALLDKRIPIRTPEVLHFLKCNATRVRITSNHAKVTVIDNDSWQIVVVGSANMNNNPRYEASVIDTHPDAAQLHSSWIDNELQKAHTLT